MVPGLGRSWVCTLLLLCQWPSYADSKCCEKKVVPGLSSKAGTYNLVSNSDPVPGFCLGGCVYTKENDPQPGTNYCFQKGDMNVACSGGGCGGGQEVEGWIEKYFQKECSMQINSVVKLSVQKQYSYQQQCGYSNSYIANVSVELYDNPSCDGAAVQKGMSESTGYYSEAVFLIKVNDTKPWSVFVSKEGFKSECQDIGMMVPFTNNYDYIYMMEDVLESELIPTVSLNFTFDINNELLTDVFVQGNPPSCMNNTYPFRSSARKTKTKNKKFKQKSESRPDYDFFAKKPTMARNHGSGSGSGIVGGYNYKCSPTCRYASWNTDPSITPCACKGVIGGGLNFSDITLPNQQTPAGGANMSGSLFWYDDTFVPFQFFTAFAEFSRRNSTSVRVCDSNLSISLQSKISPRTVQKNVPCFPPQIPPTMPMPTYPTVPTFPFPGGSGFPGLPTHSPGISDGSLDSGLTPSPPTTPDSPGSGSGVRGTWPTSYPQWLTTTPDEDQFQFLDGVLIWGKGDGFWIVGCMAGDDIDTFLPLEVDFFTAKDPRNTPEFCGCLLSTMQVGQTEATREAVKECYVKALAGGPSPTNIGRKKKMTKKRGKKLQKHQERKWKNKDKKLQKRLRKLERLNRHQKTGKSMKNLKKFVRKMKAKQQKFKPGRSKRDVTDKELYEVDFAEEEFDENMFDEEVLSGDEISMDFGNTFDFEEYGDTYDESEDYIEQDYEFEDDSLSSDW